MELVHPIIWQRNQGGKPRVGYVNLLSLGTIVSSGDDASFPKENVYDWKTFTYWKPSAPGTATLTLTLPTARLANYFAFHGTDLSDNAGSIKLQYSTNGTTWVDISATIRAPGNSAAVMVIFSGISAKHWRVVVVSNSAASYFANIAFGPHLQMEQGCFVGFQPPTLARDTETINNMSEGGEFLGRSIIRKGCICSLNLEYLSPEWVRSSWMPFVEHAELKSFFLLWHRENYPAEAAFMWTRGDIGKPSNSHARFMKVNMGLMGQYE